MATFGSRNLKKGSTGSDVRELQTKLNSLGYNCGKVDGIFGTNTLAAVKRFQQDNKLAVDGIAGKNTFKKLAEAIEKQKNKSTSTNSGSSGSTGSSTSSKTTSTTTSKSTSSTVTLTSGDAPSVEKDELRIGIQTKGSTSSASSAKNSGSGDTSVKTETTVSTTTSNIFYPPIEGDVTWDTERSGSPGKLTFKVRADIPISEGDMVSVTYGDKKVFMGYIFDRSIDKSGAVSITAYDQLKYFNNTDTYVLDAVKASQVISRIASDYGMKTGTIEDTGIVIPTIVEDNQTLFDIVYNALDKTVAAGNKVYVFYDDYGKLTLKSLDSMRVNLMLCEDTVGDYDYKSSIDDEVYNQIVLYYDDEKTKKREYFTASSAGNIGQWGLLRKTEKIDATEKEEEAQNLANLYLAMYNKKVRKLSVKEAFGRPDVRAGALVPVIMKVGEISLRNYMLVEKATHTWSNGKYFMNLDLSGAGAFSV